MECQLTAEGQTYFLRHIYTWQAKKPKLNTTAKFKLAIYIQKGNNRTNMDIPLKCQLKPYSLTKGRISFLPHLWFGVGKSENTESISFSHSGRQKPN